MIPVDLVPVCQSFAEAERSFFTWKGEREGPKYDTVQDAYTKAVADLARLARQVAAGEKAAA